MSRARALPPLAIVLVISLAVNALLIGLFAGNLLGRPDHPGDRGPRGGNSDFMMARSIEDVVPEADRDQIRQAFRQAFRDSRDIWTEKRAARTALSEALAAEPFDAAAVDQAFADMRAADQALTARFQSVLSQELADLSVEQRATLVERLNEINRRRMERVDRHKDRRGPPDDGDGPPGDGPPPPPR